MPVLFFRDGVVPAPAERIAAQDPVQCQKKAFEGAEPLDGLYRVIGAGGVEPAARFFQRRNRALVKPDAADQQPFHRRTPAAFRWRSIARRTCWLFAIGVRARATNTRSQPPATRPESGRNAARITRRDRLRRTAFPVFLLVVMPVRSRPLRFFTTYVTRMGLT